VAGSGPDADAGGSEDRSRRGEQGDPTPQIGGARGGPRLDVVLPELHGEAGEGVRADDLVEKTATGKPAYSGGTERWSEVFFVILMRLMSDWERSKSSASTPSTATSPRPR